jgi:zinc protease
MKTLFLPLAFALIAAPAFAAATPKEVSIGAGEQVWFEEDHTVPMVAVTIALPAGSAYDPANKPGLAAFAAYMFNEGAGDLSSVQYQSALANKAIQLTMTPDRDYLLLSVSTLSSNAKEAFRLLALALQHPHMDADAVERVRAQMLQSLLTDAQDPQNVTLDRFYEIYFANHPYAHNITGTAAGLKAVTPADLKAFVRTHWVKAGAKISVAGDIDAVTLKALLKANFDPLPAAAPPAVAPVSRVGLRGVMVVPMDVPQATAIFGLPGLLRADPAYLAGYVANYVVGGGDFSSRLTDEVRTKRGLTYGISTSFGDYQRAGYVIGQVATRRESMSQSLDVIRATLANYAAHGPTQAELNDAKTYLTGSYPLAFSSNTGIAAQLNTFQRAGLPIGYVTDRNARINALTLDQVRAAAARLFDPKAMTVVVGGSIVVASTHPKPPRKPASHS